MKYKAVVFDLDGTLVHTSPEYRYRVVGQALRNMGRSISKQNIDRFWFESNRNAIIKDTFGLDPDRFWKTFYSYDSVELRREFTKVYDDVEFLHELREQGYKTGIVTGAPVHIADLEVGMIGAELFDTVVVAHTSRGCKPKPHPQSLQECLSLLEVKKTEAIYVGNANEDVLTAKNAEVFDVLLTRGDYDFRDSNPSLVIGSLFDLRALLNSQEQ